mmetsp:Transcript_112940/g.326265  ORF Transcript_112940/g.326265 Transcript_112940/m.326265 type:complete len:161 (-) Transcript_112940:559-1041(-)
MQEEGNKEVAFEESVLVDMLAGPAAPLVDSAGCVVLTGNPLLVDDDVVEKPVALTTEALVLTEVSGDPVDAAVVPATPAAVVEEPVFDVVDTDVDVAVDVVVGVVELWVAVAVAVVVGVVVVAVVVGGRPEPPPGTSDEVPPHSVTAFTGAFTLAVNWPA